MVDLQGQYQRIKSEIDEAIQEVLDSSNFIKGPKLSAFENNLATYLNVGDVIGCANGTDALQIALMSLNLERGDEVIIPSFTYVATAEVVALLGLTPVMVDVDLYSFNVTASLIEQAITCKTKAIIAVHLFGQSSDMEPIMTLAKEHDLFVIEDNAQSIGAELLLRNGNKIKSGTIGHISCTSFFPSKNLGCYGDGGAICTNDHDLAQRIRMIANHGQRIKYHHDIIGCNSRLDAIQAAVLDVKLKYLDEYCNSRREAADYYTKSLIELSDIITPRKFDFSSHVFHQYTMQISEGRRDALALYLKKRNIASAIYYPLPLYKQKAFQTVENKHLHHSVTEQLCETVLSIPIHTELTYQIQDGIIEAIFDFFKG